MKISRMIIVMTNVPYRPYQMINNPPRHYNNLFNLVFK